MDDGRKFIGLRVSPELHKTIKQIALDQDMTIQDYCMGLISNDIKTRKKLMDTESNRKGTGIG